MKIQVDITNREELISVRAELVSALAIVDKALEAHRTPAKQEKKKSKPTEARKPSPVVISNAPVLERIREAIARAPKQFKAADISSQFPESEKVRVKEELKNQRAKGNIRITQDRVGRTPAVYEKTA